MRFLAPSLLVFWPFRSALIGRMGMLKLIPQRLAEKKSGEDDFATFKIGPTSVLSEAVVPLIEMARRTEARDIRGNIVEDA